MLTAEVMDKFIAENKYLLTEEALRAGVPNGPVDQDALDILRQAYRRELNPDDMLAANCPVIKSLHPTLMAIGGFLHDGEREEEEITEILQAVGEKFGHRSPELKDTRDVARWVLKKEPVEIEPLKTFLPPFVQDGCTAETQEGLDQLLGARLIKAQRAAEITTSEDRKFAEDANIAYPYEVWAGTEYAEFAEICGRDNFIPKEFLIEAIKTITGSVLGAQLEIPTIEGAVPRFYTVLMGGAGSGKGTAISWAANLFREIHLGGTALTSLLWSPADNPQDIKWVNVGACEEGFSSAPGMQRSNQKGQKRWLQTYEELDHMIEGSGIEGSGKALMGANRQLYDREDFVTTSTGKRDACSGRAQNSILSGTTPELWSDMFAGKSVRGSGLFQRFNLIVSEEKRKKGGLRKPQLDLFKSTFTNRIMAMDKNPVKMALADAVVPAVDEWFSQDRFQDADGEVRGRLNILAWRNALHLAWQRDKGVIELREILDAFKLSEYQFEMRRRHTPAEGDTPWALVENKISTYLSIYKQVSRRELVRALHLDRYGSTVTDRALQSIKNSGDLELLFKEGHGPKSLYARWVD